MTCPIFMVAAPASRQGKTLISASLARLYQQQGYQVRVFKLGPDFLDPKILECASGQPVNNLDLWIMGETYCRTQLLEARQHNDIVLIESVMGLFDHQPSNADFARIFNIPIVLLIDASSMGASFAAIAYGMTHFYSDLNFLGILANRVGSNSHQQLIQQNLPTDINFLGAIPRDKRLEIPERHLGLYQPEEFKNINSYLNAAANVLLEANISLPITPRKKNIITQVLPKNHKANISSHIIAVSKDAAFSFIYQANLDYLQSLGCEIVFFSPLHDNKLPNCHAVWLTGGYPECFAAELSQNIEMKKSITQHIEKDKPIYAECGGMLYLFDTLKTQQGNKHAMCGLLAGKVIMEKKFQGIGLQELTIFDDSIRGHSFHHARVETSIQPMQLSQHQRQSQQGEAFYANKNIYASFLHLWFAESKKITKELFRIE